MKFSFVFFVVFFFFTFSSCPVLEALQSGNYLPVIVYNSLSYNRSEVNKQFIFQKKITGFFHCILLFCLFYIDCVLICTYLLYVGLCKKGLKWFYLFLFVFIFHFFLLFCFLFFLFGFFFFGFLLFVCFLVFCFCFSRIYFISIFLVSSCFTSN